MIESGGDGAERSHASAFQWTPDGGREDGGAVDGRPGGLAEDAMAESGGAEEARVRPALAPLGRLASLPVREHVAVFEQVLTGLEATLATVAGENRAATAATTAAATAAGGDGGAGVGGEAVVP